MAAKAPSPIVVTWAGTVKLVRPLLLKVLAGMVVSVVFQVAEVSEGMKPKTAVPIVVTGLGITTVVRRLLVNAL